ncbi:hypothetical protein VPH35_127137 [Triticum aestivum]
MHVASPDEWRNWASLPGDVLCIILTKDVPLLWRHIDLRPDPWDQEHEEYCSWDEQPLPTGWKAMARSAVERSAGRCESFSGHVDADVLIIKKLPLLECLVMSDGCFQIQLLNALLDHCPRLELLDVTKCWPTDWEEPISTRIRNCSIKDLRLPDEVLE